MAQYQVSVDSELLHQLFFRQDRGMARLLEQVLNQVLEAQATDQLKAAPYERTEERQGYRNGHRPRMLITRVGRIVLAVPRTREGGFSTDLFSRYQRSEQALVLALIEMVVNGVATRKVSAVVEELCEVGISRSTVSELCKRLDAVVKAWNGRDLSGQVYPFLIVDALVIRVDDAMAVMALPERYRKRLRTTNVLERLNEEIRRRERAIRIFPNEASAERLIGAVLMENDEVWTTGHRYLDMKEYWMWRAEREARREEGASDDSHNQAA